jgi:hypothetical protein
MAGLGLALLATGLPSRLGADQGRSNRPFVGVAAGAITGIAPDGAIVAEATGHATHLGDFTRIEYVYFGPGGTISGTVIFTADNLDELWVDFSGGFTSETTAEGTYTFTGGTGRFTDATGTASFAATLPDGIHFAVSFGGSIGY